MNELINWLALNNTLMIRIGFTAIGLLIIAYAFRFFFVPKINTVSEAHADQDSKVSGHNSNMNIEELAELQTEIEQLKEKLKVVEVEKNDLLLKIKSVSPVNSASAEVSVSASGGTEMVTTEQNNRALTGEAQAATQTALDQINTEKAALVRKIELLEARLAEYEIIAEDIAEIGQLKTENAELKTKIKDMASEPKAEQNKIEVVTADEEIDSLLSLHQEEAAPQDTEVTEAAVASSAASGLVLTSEIEVPESEIKILDSFENFQRQKKAKI